MRAGTFEPFLASGLCLTPVPFLPLEDGYSHYSVTVHGCRIAFLYWPLLESARPVKFLWKLEQVRREGGPLKWMELSFRGFQASGVVVVVASMALSLVSPGLVYPRLSCSQGLLLREAFVD